MVCFSKVCYIFRRQFDTISHSNVDRVFHEFWLFTIFPKVTEKKIEFSMKFSRRLFFPNCLTRSIDYKDKREWLTLIGK